MAIIELTRDRYAILDDKDVPLVEELSWGVNNYGYVKADLPRPTRGTLLMHHLFLKFREGFDVDHINGDKLDNRRENLRYATRSQNMANRDKPVSNTSGYKGVSWESPTKKWVARIGAKAKRIGAYTCKGCAALAYNKAALDKYGEFARINREINHAH